MYRLIATLALLHMLVLGAGAAYLVLSGRLDADRLRQVVAVIRGEEAEPETGTEPGEMETTPKAVSLDASRDEKQIRDEVAWRNAERYRTQLEQRLKFIRAERLDVDRRREEFEQLKQKEMEQRQETARKAANPGYAKELEVIAALSPKVALRQLMTMTDVDVAGVLFKLDTRKTKKIVEAAKTDIQRAKVTTALQLMRDFKPPAADETSGQEQP